MDINRLKSNVRGIGDLFFSGSQSVYKGDEVAWALDETFAFRATEECMVSTNASPFVMLGAGDTYIIYKRTAEDIAEGNSKGIYIFDRDTTVQLAYPQETTQDIVIQNDMYNNNMNTVIVEADKTPTAKISVSNAQPYIGTPVTISGLSSYAVSPATIASYKWIKNGVEISTHHEIVYVENSVRTDDIVLVVTDSDGKKANSSYTIAWKSVPEVTPPDGGGSNPPPKPKPDLTFSRTFKEKLGIIAPQWRTITTDIVKLDGTGTITTTALINVFTQRNDYVMHPIVRVLLGSTEIARGTISIPIGTNQNFTITATGTIKGSVNSSQTYTIQIQLAGATSSTKKSLTMGGSIQPSDTLQIKLTNRTA